MSTRVQIPTQAVKATVPRRMAREPIAGHRPTIDSHLGQPQAVHLPGLSHQFGKVRVNQNAPVATQIKLNVSESGKKLRQSVNMPADSDGSGFPAVESAYRDAEILSTIRNAGSGTQLPAVQRARLAQFSGHSLRDVRIHDNMASHRAARMLEARAFTLGGSIYFGANECQPALAGKGNVLAHEVAHTIQQKGTSVRPGPLEVVTPHGTEEREAEHFAKAAFEEQNASPRLSFRRTSIARVMRVISFTRSNDQVSTRQAGIKEHADDFDMAPESEGGPHFEWQSNFTIQGDTGDPFDAYELGPLQVVRDIAVNIFYGDGARQTVRRGRATVPARDEVAGQGPDWFDGRFVSGAGSFGKSGEKRLAQLRDSPGLDGVEFENPVRKPGPPTTTGRFEWVQASIAYLSARNTKVAGAAGFQPLAHVLWRIGMAGVFDSSRPEGKRIIRTQGGKPTRAKVVSGISSQYPPMHGGNAAAITWKLE